MITNDLLEFVKLERTKGLTDEAIKIALVGNGWAASDIDEAYKALSVQTPLPSNVVIADPKPTFGLKALIIGLLIVLLGGGSAFAYYRVKNTSIEVVPKETSQVVTTTNQVDSVGSADLTTTEGSKNVGTFDYDVSIDVTTTENCGSAGCFEKKFTACEKATMTSSMEDFGGASYYYKIIGPMTGGCQMLTKYTTNPNPDWVNKEMTCVYNNKKSIQDATDDVFNGIFDGSVTCQGPLFTVLTSLAN